MLKLLRNIRFYIFVVTILLSIAEYIWVSKNTSSSIRVLTLTRLYGLTAVFYLYIALLIGPLTWVFPRIPFRGLCLKARRAIGVSAFYFSILHARTALFDLLGGFSTLFALDMLYQVAILLSTAAIVILALMAATSFDAMIRKLTFPRWKRLHRLVYIAGIFILVHATLIGGDFKNIWQPIPIILYVAVAILVMLHAIGLYKKIKD